MRFEKILKAPYVIRFRIFNIEKFFMEVNFIKIVTKMINTCTNYLNKQSTESIKILDPSTSEGPGGVPAVH